MFQLGPRKALGPDGIPAFFYQEFWDIVRNDVFRIVHAFFHSSFLLKTLNHTYTTLIPKVSFVDEVSHFRPISLCNVIYKVISKLMVNRLKPFMDNLINPFKNAFIRDRNISDNILIAHEIFDYLRKKKGRKHCFGALKVDMSKAYGKVDWKFLKAALTAMNFNAFWVNWIMECVTIVRYTLLINGNLSHSFIPKKGLKQGDPLSPYLFLICENILSLALMQVENQKKIRGVKLGKNDTPLIHLFFADDALLFFRHDALSLSNLQLILNRYYSLSG